MFLLVKKDMHNKQDGEPANVEASRAAND